MRFTDDIKNRLEEYYKELYLSKLEEAYGNRELIGEEIDSIYFYKDLYKEYTRINPQNFQTIVNYHFTSTNDRDIITLKFTNLEQQSVYFGDKVSSKETPEDYRKIYFAFKPLFYSYNLAKITKLLTTEIDGINIGVSNCIENVIKEISMDYLKTAGENLLNSNEVDSAMRNLLVGRAAPRILSKKTKDSFKDFYQDLI